MASCFVACYDDGRESSSAMVLKFLTTGIPHDKAKGLFCLMREIEDA